MVTPLVGIGNLRGDPDGPREDTRCEPTVTGSVTVENG